MLKFYLQALFQSAQHLYEKREGSGSIPLTNGSGGSGRPKNIRIRIPNNAFKYKFAKNIQALVADQWYPVKYCVSDLPDSQYRHYQ